MLLAAVLYFSSDVRSKLDEMASSTTDNVQWSLSQIQVEFLLLEEAMLHSHVTWSEYDTLQRRYDIFYSRITTLQQSVIYEDLRMVPEFKVALDGAYQFLSDTVSFIDGPRAELRDALPEMIELAHDAHSDVRALSLFGVSHFVNRADQRRTEVTKTLTQVGGLTIVTFTFFGVVLVALLRVYDSTQQRASALALVSSRLEAVVGTALDAIVVADRDGRIMEFNPAAEAIFGYKRDEVIGQDMARVIIPPHLREAHRNGMARHLETGKKRVIDSGRIELEAMRRDGTIFPVELAVSTARSRGRDVFISYLRDISSRRAADAALLKARDDALAGEKAKADMLAVMSHEIRTPLNGMLGTLDLLKDSATNDEQKEYLRLMDVSGRQLLHHVNDVLDITRLDASTMTLNEEPFDLAETVLDLAASFEPTARNGSNELIVEGADAPIWVTGDVVRLRQILVNLIGNALKFTLVGKVKLVIAQLSEDGLVEIAVEDTGIGIAPEDLKRVFEDFVTLDSTYDRKVSGTGLGLGISRRIVEAMGGTIDVQSELDVGTRVEMCLPMPAAEMRDHAQLQDVVVRPANAQVMTVLIVEDNPINRIVLRRMLERGSHTVHEAHDGVEGVKMAESYRYDVILMDISMPKLNGVDATRAIRAGDGASRDVPIVATTAHAQQSDREKFLDAGMSHTLIKPITQQTLFDVLDEFATGVGAARRSAGLRGPMLRPVPADDLIDATVIGALAHAMGSEAVSEIMGAFQVQGEALMARLRSSDDPIAEAEDLAAEMHKLAGSAGVLGANPLASELSQLEMMVRAQQYEPLRHRLKELPCLWERTIVYLAD
ncbi:hybrid sensor histidine kinase/response regulator [Pontivivens insulae]|uniref:hybrid sensor histidine kinase/response regulator n=1 Tax=Pontivivens insulae TaxID=1639689 RepID=UPI0011B27A31|nr:PAS domain-containing hybrid sensor histidine kinase/response regulator [Pontivivens insulae]